MANHKSAQKRILQNERRRLRNQHYKSTVRNLVKALREAIDKGDGAQASSLLPGTIRQIDKVASKGILPKNRASRIVSRLTLAVNKAQG